MATNKIDEVAAEVAQETPPKPTVHPSPLPTVFNIGQAEVNGQTFVVLQATTPAGTAIYFIDGSSAEGLGTSLTRIGSMSKAGLVMP